MQESGALMLSSTYAAAQLALTLWVTILLNIVFTRPRPALGRDSMLALLAMVASTWVWREKSLAIGWPATWLVSCLLSAMVLVVALSRWVGNFNQPTSSVAARFDYGPAAMAALALVGFVLTLNAVTQVQKANIPSASIRWCGWIYLISTTIVFGSTLVSTLELTIGETGDTLLALPWGRLSLLSSVAFVLQIVLSAIVVGRLPAAEQPLETLAPVLYCFGMLLLSYIAWCIPRQMMALAKKKTTVGQASLALSGWIAVLCFCVATALPPYWPWQSLK